MNNVNSKRASTALLGGEECAIRVWNKSTPLASRPTFCSAAEESDLLSKERELTITPT
jgi:hypothetical protein